MSESESDASSISNISAQEFQSIPILESSYNENDYKAERRSAPHLDAIEVVETFLDIEHKITPQNKFKVINNLSESLLNEFNQTNKLRLKFKRLFYQSNGRELKILKKFKTLKGKYIKLKLHKNKKRNNYYEKIGPKYPQFLLKHIKIQNKRIKNQKETIKYQQNMIRRLIAAAKQKRKSKSKV